jgi:hypothetical protein
MVYGFLFMVSCYAKILYTIPISFIYDWRRITQRAQRRHRDRRVSSVAPCAFSVPSVFKKQNQVDTSRFHIEKTIIPVKIDPAVRTKNNKPKTIN